MDDGREEQGEDLQIGEPVLNPRLSEKPVGGLQHVAGVEIVVVGVGVLGVAQLQVTQQVLQRRRGDFVLVKAAMVLENMVT
jgi:hypothetical protein